MSFQQIAPLEQNLQNLNLGGDQNPYAANMQQQFALQQMQAQAQREGVDKVNESFQAFAEEMRQNHEAMARRCLQLEERLLTAENNLKLEQEAHSNNMKQCAATIEQLSSTIQELGSTLATNKEQADNKIKALEERYNGHMHTMGQVHLTPLLFVPARGTSGPNK